MVRFKEISLDSRYKIGWKNLINSLLALKLLKQRNTTQKRANYEKRYELYEKYYNAYKSDYDTDDELNEAKKKMFDYKQFQLDNKIDKESKLDEEKKDLKLTALPIWLSS